jgi:hypothetical protein
MKTCIGILKTIVLACALAAACSAQIEFVGYMISPDGARYVLKKSGEEKASRWLALGDSYMGFKLLTHDQTHETLVVEKDGARMEVSLKSARVLPLPPWRHKVQGTKIQFVGESLVSEDAVRQLMQVRAGSEVDEVSLDRDIRAVYRTDHFESVEFKLEIVDANTRNLLVILKPKARNKTASSK